MLTIIVTRLTGLCEQVPQTFDVRNYSSVSEAAAACRAAGGGRIVVPKGVWRSNGPVHLASDCELHLADGAELIFSDNPKDYLPAVRVAYEGVECYNYSPLVYAFGATNVAVTGTGTLRAAHAFWYAWNWHNPESRKALDDLADVWPAEGRPVTARDMTKIPGCRLRPQFLHFNRCRNVRVEGVRIRESPFWCIHTYACDGGVVRNVDVCFERVTAAHLEGAPVAVNATYFALSRPGVETALTRIRDIRVKDVTADEAACAYSLRGDPDSPIEGVTLENVIVRRRTGGPDVAENVKGFRKE